MAEPPRLLFTGNITKSKGLGDVAKALSLVRSPVEWVLCGKDQGYLATLRNQIKDCNVNHRLTWAGTLYPDALRTQVHTSDCFVFCSWSEVETGSGWGEGLGKSLLEAMSCGLPVIVSNIQTFQEIIVDGQNGLMVPVRDPRGIARAIEAYLSNPHLRVHCGLNARKTIENGFDKQAEIEAWRAMLDSKSVGAVSHDQI